MGKTIVITGAKGGCGKTALTAALGYALAQQEKSTCVADLCMGRRNLDLVVFDLNDLACEDCTMEQALLSAPIKNLSLVAAPQQMDAEGMGERPLQKVLNRLQKRFDYLLCDVPDAFDPVAQAACKAADAVVIVTVPGDAAARNAEHASSLLHDLTEAPLYLLMNCLDRARVAGGQVTAPDALAAYLDLPLIGMISQHEAVYAAQFTHKLPDAYPEKIRKEIDDTARRLCGEDVPMKPCTARRFPWHSFANN